MKKSIPKRLVRRPREKVYLLSLYRRDLIALRDACVCSFNLSLTSLDKEMYGNLIKNLDSQIY